MAERWNWYSAGVTVALYIVALFMVVLLGITKMRAEFRVGYMVDPDPIVIAFLDEFTSVSFSIDQEAVIEKYLVGVDKNTVDHEGRTQDTRNFEAVFQARLVGCSGYRVCASKQDYLEIMLTDEDGHDLPCRIGLFYRVSANGRITSYSVCRLQPVSKLDQEWDVMWR